MAIKRRLKAKSDEATSTDCLIVQAPLAQITQFHDCVVWTDRSIVQQLAAQIPWFPTCVLLDRVADLDQRQWYICTEAAKLDAAIEANLKELGYGR